MYIKNYIFNNFYDQYLVLLTVVPRNTKRRKQSSSIGQSIFPHPPHKFGTSQSCDCFSFLTRRKTAPRHQQDGTQNKYGEVRLWLIQLSFAKRVPNPTAVRCTILVPRSSRRQQSLAFSDSRLPKACTVKTREIAPTRPRRILQAGFLDRVETLPRSAIGTERRVRF